MKLGVPRRRQRSDNVVPLINVVFLLLIFYMLTGSLTRPELFRIDPPVSKSTMQSVSEPVRVLLAADGRMALENKAMSLAEIAVAVMARRKKDPAMRVEIKADAKVAAGKVLSLLDALREAGVEKVSLTTAYQEK